MNKEEFLVALAEAARDPVINHPHLDGGVLLRLGTDASFCPLTAVAANRGAGYYMNGNYTHAGEAIGLEDRLLAYEIAAAADGYTTYSFLEEGCIVDRPVSPTLRAELLAACGLQP